MVAIKSCNVRAASAALYSDTVGARRRA